ncbi:MAG: hypothetical protein Q9217_002118, partial [Psora testacea]
MPPTKPKGDYIETDTGNKVARRTQLHGTQHIILGGRTVIQPEVCIRGDLVRPAAAAAATATATAPAPTLAIAPAAPAAPSKDPKDTKDLKAGNATYNTSVNIGRYSFVSTGAVLKPPSRMHKGQVVYHPLKIGDHVFVGERSVVEAASIGDHVHIGPRAVVGK